MEEEILPDLFKRKEALGIKQENDIKYFDRKNRQN